MIRHPIAKLAPAALLLLALPGCISFGEKPPKSLLSLTADAKVPAGVSNSARDVNAVSVAIPATPGALNNQRIAVLSNNAFAYVPKAVWVDTPARLFRNVLAETVEAKTGRFVPDVRNAAITPDTRLGGTLVAFELLGGQGKVLVIYDATLAKSGSDTIQTRRFEATSPVSSEEPEAVSASLNRAANAVANDVAAWVGNLAG
jgi:cholesterol transport system auxiliary component